MVAATVAASAKLDTMVSVTLDTMVSVTFDTMVSVTFDTMVSVALDRMVATTGTNAFEIPKKTMKERERNQGPPAP